MKRGMADNDKHSLLPPAALYRRRCPPAEHAPTRESTLLLFVTNIQQYDSARQKERDLDVHLF